MKFHAKDSLFFAYLLNLFFPGLGHALWGEYLFGIFIYLIMLLASALAYLSFFVAFNGWMQALLFGMPTLFFVFSFVDLTKSIRGRRAKHGITARRGILFITLGVAHLLLAPNSPANFALRNRPEVTEIHDNEYSPRLRRSDVAVTNSLAYWARLQFIDQPVLYDLPERFDVIRYNTPQGTSRIGLVLGLPGESVEIVGGTIVANGSPLLSADPLAARLTGDWSLTYTGSRSILVATLHQGEVSSVHEVSVQDVQGKVQRVF